MRNPIEFTEFENKILDLTGPEFEILKDDSFKGRIDVSPVSSNKYLVSTKEYVGNIVLPEHTLIIRPKIPNLNFFQMLFQAQQFIPELKNEDFEYEQEEDIYEIIVKRLLDEVRGITCRGLSKGYVEFEENLHLLRQRVLIREDLTKNPVLRDKVYCKFDDFTIDVPENRVIKYALYRILSLPFRNSDLYRRARFTMCEFEGVSLRALSGGCVPRIRYTRLNEHYRTAINLATLIIEYATLSLQSTGEIRFSSFLVDMNRLFQEFLLVCIRRKLRGFRVMSESSHPFDIEEEVKMRPDIVVSKSKKNVLVIDAKYRQVNSQSEDIHGATSDLSQIHTYSVILNLPYGVLVYPRHGESTDSKEIHAHGGKRIVKMYVDLAQTRKDFAAEVQRFVDAIESLIETKVLPVLPE